jgi:UDP-N-acetylmuramoylalanine--D-glutamate ligase
MSASLNMRWPRVFSGRRYAVVGLGRNGLPAARTLLELGAEVTVWDDNATARQAATGMDVREPQFDRLDALILSPGIPHRLPRAHPLAARAIAAGVPILSDAELLYQAVRQAGSAARFVGITGTNGKSTTTALVAHILRTAAIAVAAGGNLGTASLALPLLPPDAVYVLEMSSYMLERLATLRFCAATMLNISPDHLDRHGNMAGYTVAKRAIFSRQQDDDVAVVGMDDPDSRLLAESLPRRVTTISALAPADYWARGSMLHAGRQVIADLSDAVALPGAHNAQNAAAAAALSDALGVPRSALVDGLRTYPGLPHRQEAVGTIAGVTFVNDSKATNADSAARALACYDRLIWIAGGTAKEGGIASLAPLFPRIAHAFLIGRDAPLLASDLAAHGVRFDDVGTLDHAVASAWDLARTGGAQVVLLSPACASWDQFTGFDQRGDRFRALVQAIETELAVSRRAN